MPLSSQRKYRIEWILGRMRESKAAGLTIEKKKLISAACIEFGAGTRYINELIQDLLNVETLILSGNLLYFKEDFIKELNNK